MELISKPTRGPVWPQVVLVVRSLVVYGPKLMVETLESIKQKERFKVFVSACTHWRVNDENHQVLHAPDASAHPPEPTFEWGKIL
jgi:hypothetical protein